MWEIWDLIVTDSGFGFGCFGKIMRKIPLEDAKARLSAMVGQATPRQSLILKTVALTDPLKKALEPYSDKIKAAFVYGSVAKGVDTAQSDIDLTVIGDELDYAELYTALQNAEDVLRRKINPIFLSPEDWRRKASQTGSFISEISAVPKLFIFGSEKDTSAS